MVDFSLVLEGVLITVIVGVSIKYYSQLRKAQKEYQKAKEAVDDIVLSFNNQLKREAEQLEHVAYKVEALTSRSERALKGAEETSKKMQALEPRVSAVIEDTGKMVARLDDFGKKLGASVISQEALTKEVNALKEQVERLPAAPETKIEAVIPIKREKALAPLTETELAVLEMLTSEGPRTAPVIKERIRLSREHTARLMKKLYEEGYLERNTGKIPFEYRVKEEMGKLLKKTESGAT